MRSKEDLLFDLKLLDNLVGITFYIAAIPQNYHHRAIKLDGFENISVYVFAREDIIASKIDRLDKRDIEDIKILLKDTDYILLENCIDETYMNIVYEDRKKRYQNNLLKFRELFGRGK